MSKRGWLVVGAGLLLALSLLTRTPRAPVELAARPQTPMPVSSAAPTAPAPTPAPPPATPIPLLETLVIARVTIATVILGDEWLYFGRGEHARARIEVRNEGRESLAGCTVRWGDATPGSGAFSEPFALAPGEGRTLLMTSRWAYAAPGHSNSVIEAHCNEGRSLSRDEPVLIVAGL